MEDSSRIREEVVTRYPKEVKTFVWQIKDLATILAAPDFCPSPPPSIQFYAGESIEMPSKLKLELFPEHQVLNQVNLTLRLVWVEYPKGGLRGFTNFTCEAVVKRCNAYGGGNLKTVNLQPGCSTHLITWNELRKEFGNQLTIHLKFEICANPVTVGKMQFSDPMKRRMAEDVANNFGVLLETGHNSDFVIKVKKSETEGEWVEMKVHKAILGSRSMFFERMLDTEMTESTTATLEIVDLSPDCVKLLLKWIYTGILDEAWKNVPDEMVKAADKYRLDLLQFLDQNLHHSCNFENAISLREVAKLHGLVTATKRITNFMAENLERVLD